jgi:GT2 family glycosyltransferase
VTDPHHFERQLLDAAIRRVPRLTVGILTYNGRHLLETLLPSLAAQRDADLATVVVDNGSTDDTVEWLKATWPDVRVISLPRNVGVTAALNVCLSAGDGEFVAVLNNDVELAPDCVSELVSALRKHPKAAVVTAKLIDFDDRRLLDGAGDRYEWTGLASRRGQGERDAGQYDQSREIFGACGCVAMYRRSVLDAIGGFDDQLYAFYEDVDWSFRAWLRGYSCRYVPTAVAYHMGGATLGREPNDFTLYQYWRNTIWVVAKNYPASALLRHGYRFVNSQRGNLLWAMKTGHGQVFIRAWRDALRGMPTILRKRRVVQRSRTIGLHELERVIGADS